MEKIIYTKEEIKEFETVASLNYDWDKFKNKTIMISGGTGFIGSRINEVIKIRNEKYNNNITVVNISRHKNEDSKYIKYLQADINDKINYDGDIDYIIHLASNTHPDSYKADPVGTITSNVIGANNLLSLAKDKKNCKFLLASSVEIYGECKNEFVNEDYSGYINCNNYRAGYNEAKRTSETLCHSYYAQYGLDSVIARFSRCFGADRKKDSKAIAQFMDKALNGEDIVMNSKGNQRYSYCYVMDAVSAIFFLLINGKTNEAYNVSGEDENKTLGDYASLIASFANKKVIFDIKDNDSASKAVYALLDTTKINELGFKTMFNVSDSLYKTYLIKKDIGK